jgi:hypothetical protein
VFREWLADYAVDPWDEYRGDLRTAVLCSLVDAERLDADPRPPIEYMRIVKRFAAEPAGGVVIQPQAEMDSAWARLTTRWNKK